MRDLMKYTDGDLRIENNDVVIGDSDNQQREDLLVVEKGSVKQFPDAGVGVYKFLESENGSDLLREIGLQFTADGMDVKAIDVKDNQIYVDAPYQ